ncbi:hypothetical protein CC78DRAFT_478581 [Lojkania enalia]|uniref:Heterokaryon incompatibility domain-containing protein n=1 Tax=Lojkania enalia TaxID=147567 RepID=A0A9P4JXK8_9PLEO|nr:hypothetical protein CC78DRAFT_478581 [Didymosphaeria enalia]
MRLEPSSDRNAPLRFSFRADTIDKFEHRYEAISYAWGERVSSRRLHCTENNADVWADAVCICQSDDTEKSSQIPLMRDIYKEASPVLVWVGNGALKRKDCECFPIFRGLLRMYPLPLIITKLL